MFLFLLFALSFCLSFLTVGFIRQYFRRQLLDLPNERSSHSQPTPRGGGVGFILAFLVTHLAYEALLKPSNSYLSWWLVVISLITIGIIDDRQGVSARIRYLVQLSAAIIAIWYWGVFPFPWVGSFGVGGEILAALLTIIGVTCAINFYNFMDGLDGLVAGCSAIQLGFAALYFHLPFLWLLVAALSGFLYWNWSPAKIFMGDVGSTFLGAIAALIILQNTNEPVKAWSALAVTLPILADAVYTLFRRLLNGANIFQAHRTHLYQRLQQSGWPHGRVTAAYMGMNLFIALAIAFFAQWGAWLSLLTVIMGIVWLENYLQSAYKIPVSAKK